MRERLIAIIGLTVLLTGCTEATSVLNGEVLLDSGKIERMIEQQASAQLGGEMVVECPDPMSAAVGDSRQCIINDEFGNTEIVDVTVQNREGYIIWKIQG